MFFARPQADPSLPTRIRRSGPVTSELQSIKQCEEKQSNSHDEKQYVQEGRPQPSLPGYRHGGRVDKADRYDQLEDNGGLRESAWQCSFGIQLTVVARRGVVLETATMDAGAAPLSAARPKCWPMSDKNARSCRETSDVLVASWPMVMAGAAVSPW